MLEQLELGALLESTLPCLRLVIHLREFLPRKKKRTSVAIMMRQIGPPFHSPRQETFSRQRRRR